MPELRKDYFLDRYVIVATERKKRPDEFVKPKKSAEKKEKICFFCPGNEKTTPPEISRIEKNGKWVVRNFPNKFPATKWHEVIAETPEHGKEIADLKVEDMVKVFELFAKRINAIEKNPLVKYVLVFKNFGEDAGASLQHSHTQIVGLEIIPSFVKEEIDAAKKYFKNKKSCPYCDIWKKEMKSERKIFEDKHTAVFAPYASEFPFEVLIMPKRHITRLEKFSKDELLSLCTALKKILLRMRKMLDVPAYNFYLHISPKKENLHLHLVLFPRLTKFAGFEFGSGVIINIVSPESATENYREGL